MTRESLALHEENCEHRVVICEDCKDKVKVGEFVLHCEELCVEK